MIKMKLIPTILYSVEQWNYVTQSLKYDKINQVLKSSAYYIEYRLARLAFQFTLSKI